MSGSWRMASGALCAIALLARCGGQSSRSGSGDDDSTSGAGGSTTPATPRSGAGGTSPTDGGPTSDALAGTSGIIPDGAPSTSDADAGGSGRPVNTDPECAEVMRDVPCAPEGKECPSLACGLGNAGRRDCVCVTSWACTTCDTARPPTPPGPEILPCPNDTAEGGSCVTESSVCGPLESGEYCACFAGDAGLVWDCERPPDSWPE